MLSARIIKETNNRITKVELSIKDKLKYYSALVLELITMSLLELYVYSQHSEFVFIEAPFVYILVTGFVIVDTYIGYKNLKFKTLNLTLNNEELSNVVDVMSKVRNWKVKILSSNSVEATSFNPKYFCDSITTIVEVKKTTTKIASYVTPFFLEASSFTFGERKRNIKYFKLATRFVKEGIKVDEVPSRIIQFLEKEENERSELSLESMQKRLAAYLIIVGFMIVPYLYRESELFIPFLIFPVIGIGYFIVDMLTIKSKSSR